MTKLNKTLALMLLAAASSPALAQQDIGAQQAQTQNQINQHNAQSQANTQQLERNMAQDRQRERQVTPPPVVVTPPPPPPPVPATP